MQLTTNVDLVRILTERNTNKQYDAIIKLASENHYHDFKSELVAPKLELVNDLAIFPELNDIREMVMNGDFDESPDEDDKNEMRGWLDDEPDGDAIKGMLGL